MTRTMCSGYDCIGDRTHGPSSSVLFSSHLLYFKPRAAALKLTSAVALWCLALRSRYAFQSTPSLQSESFRGKLLRTHFPRKADSVIEKWRRLLYQVLCANFYHCPSRIWIPPYKVMYGNIALLLCLHYFILTHTGIVWYHYLVPCLKRSDVMHLGLAPLVYSQHTTLI